MLKQVRSLAPSIARGLAKRAKRGGKANKMKGASAEEVIKLSHVQKSIPGGRMLLEDAHLTLLAGDKIGVLGANGAGKSSLLRLLAGTDTDHAGDIWRRDGVKIGMLEQEPILDDERTVLDNVIDGVSEKRSALQSFDEVNEKLASGKHDAEMDDLLAEQAELMETIDQLGCWDLLKEVEEVMAALNCPASSALPVSLSEGNAAASPWPGSWSQSLTCCS